MDFELMSVVFIIAFANLFFSLYAKLKLIQIINKRYPKLKKDGLEKVNLEKDKFINYLDWATTYNRFSIALFILIVLIMNLDLFLN